MSTYAKHEVPFLIIIIACVVSSGGVVLSIFALCLRRLLPAPKPPEAVLWKDSLPSRRHSAPPILPNAIITSEPESLSRPTSYKTPPVVQGGDARLSHGRHISFSVDQRSSLARAVISTHRRLSSFHHNQPTHSPSTSSPTSPRSSTSTSASSTHETAPAPREGSVSSAEAETVSLCSRGSSLSRRNTASRLPTSIRHVTRILNGRRRSSAETADDCSMSEAEGSAGSDAHSFIQCAPPSLDLRPKLKKPTISFSNPWTKFPSSPLSPGSDTDPSPSRPKSLTRRFTSRLGKRSPSLPPTPAPRTQPYGPPYYAAMPYFSDESSEGEPEPPDAVNPTGPTT